MKKRKQPEKEYDCTTCGACCVYFCDEDLGAVGRSGYGIFINNDDVSQLPKKLVVIEPILDTHDAWLVGKKVDGQWRCKSLVGNVGEEVVCSIYELRPQTCRNFEPGSDGCIQVRQSLGVGK